MSEARNLELEELALVRRQYYRERKELEQKMRQRHLHDLFGSRPPWATEDESIPSQQKQKQQQQQRGKQHFKSESPDITATASPQNKSFSHELDLEAARREYHIEKAQAYERMQQRREAARIPGRILEEEELEAPQAQAENLPATRQPQTAVGEGVAHIDDTISYAGDRMREADHTAATGNTKAPGDDDNGTRLPDVCTELHNRLDAPMKADDGRIGSIDDSHTSTPGDDCGTGDVSNTNSIVAVEDPESECDDFVAIMRGLQYISSADTTSSTGSSCSSSPYSKPSRCTEGESLRDFLIEELARTNRTRTSECNKGSDREYQESLLKLLRYID